MSCGKTTGQGETCCKENLCSECELKKEITIAIIILIFILILILILIFFFIFK
jgi:predicted nucleic acid-binding Zn ribbon protein